MMLYNKEDIIIHLKTFKLKIFFYEKYSLWKVLADKILNKATRSAPFEN